MLVVGWCMIAPTGVGRSDAVSVGLGGRVLTDGCGMVAMSFLYI